MKPHSDETYYLKYMQLILFYLLRLHSMINRFWDEQNVTFR